MDKKKANPIKQNLIKSILLGLTWFFLSAYMELSTTFTYVAAAAGVAFIVEGIIKYNKATKNETSQPD